VGNRFFQSRFNRDLALNCCGTYLLVSDLATEKNNGTLNFIRFSPQSTQSVLIGKMLGVPIALYITVLCALPLHLWAGLAGQIPLGRIVTFYGVLVAGCFLFYSACPALCFSRGLA
jgi:ABC-type Na+ efflux pump permease subunit